MKSSRYKSFLLVGALAAAGLHAATARAALTLDVNVNGTDYPGTPVGTAGTQVAFDFRSDPYYSGSVTISIANIPGDPLGSELQINSDLFRTGTGGVVPITITALAEGYTIPGANVPAQLNTASTLTGASAPVNVSFTGSAIAPTTNTITTTGAKSFTNVSNANNNDAALFSYNDASYNLKAVIATGVDAGKVATLSEDVIITTNVTAPEPASLGLMGVSLLSLLKRRRRTESKA